MISVAAKAEVTDADPHVVETERSWKHLEAGDQKYRLKLAPSPSQHSQAKHLFRQT